MLTRNCEVPLMMLFPMAGVCGVRVNVRWATSMTNSAAGACSGGTFTRLGSNEPVTVVTSHGPRFRKFPQEPRAPPWPLSLAHSFSSLFVIY